MKPDTLSRIEDAVRSIPPGETRSYGAVARMAGLPGRARLVGTALGQLHDDAPWHRVVNAQGKLSTRGDTARRQRDLLESEGVRFTEGGRVRPAAQPDFLLPERP